MGMVRQSKDTHPSQLMAQSFDVVMIGGSFSGASMGILLKQALPDASIAIVERSGKFDRKVGESTSEVAGCFLTQVLRLSTYLSRHHISKNGLRMWFDSEGNESLERCSEIGGRLQSRLPTFQLDRSELDPHLLKMATDAGCKLFRPATVRNLELAGAGQNRMDVDTNEGRIAVTAKWVVDASGKASVIPRLRGTLTTLEEEHPTTSVWARFQNVKDLDGRDLCTRFPEFGESVNSARGTATNHLMGRGWWCWIIPLRNGDVSAGVTFDRRLFQLKEGGTLGERLHHHLLTHPVGRELFKDAVPVENDTRIYTQLAYISREVAGDGWFVVGDAGGFLDPLYSQGLDYCGHTVYAVHKILTDALKGQCVASRTNEYNEVFRDSYWRWFQALYAGKYSYLGDAELMFSAFLLDLSLYFFGPVRLVYNHKDEEFSRLPYQGPMGLRVSKFMAFYNRRLSQIAERRYRAGVFGKKNTGRRYLVKQGLVPGLPLVAVFLRGLAYWAKAEIGSLFLRERVAQDSNTTAKSEGSISTARS